MVLHYLPERPVLSGGAFSRAPAPPFPRAGFVVGRSVGNSVVRHRVTRRLRVAVRDQLHRLPATADLVVRARPEAADADLGRLAADLSAGLDRLLGRPVPR
jgi:ribonuclease P protein component